MCPRTMPADPVETSQSVRLVVVAPLVYREAEELGLELGVGCGGCH
jgi:hypothetical protein